MKLSKGKDKRGFTLGELLIVIGILGVLVAISLPIFVRKLESAREAYDIYTMRQAASAAIDLYYMGITDGSSAQAAGLVWWQNDGANGANAAGVYDPYTGTFLPLKSTEASGMSYGKGTKTDGGTKYALGNESGAYAAKEDYTNAVVMIAIYPLGTNQHIDIYWKDTVTGKYIGGQKKANDPKYSIRILLG